MKKRRRYEDYGSLSELNVPPFLGLAFTLLVIAIVTFPLLGRAVKTAPAFFTPNRGPLVAGDIHVLAIGKNLALTWNGQATTRAGLNDALRALKPNADRCGVIIEADKSLPVQEAANLLNLISIHGIRKASLVTTPAGGGTAAKPQPAAAETRPVAKPLTAPKPAAANPVAVPPTATAKQP